MRHTYRLDGDGDLGARLIDTKVVAAGYRYTSSAVAGPAFDTAIPRQLDLTGRPGQRVPHVWLDRGGSRVSTVDLATDEFVLLASTAGEPWADAARRVAAATGVPLTLHVLGTTLEDPDGTLSEVTGIGDTGALLLRPDGFVAWRAEKAVDDPEAVLTEVFDRILARI